MLVNVVSQTWINQRDDTVQDVVFKGSTNDFVLCEYLDVVPLNCLASLRCMVNNVSMI